MVDLKVILYGDYGVGKSSLTTRLVSKRFEPSVASTIGASFVVWISANRERVGIWDTAGQERFSGLLPMYLRGADAVFYCWDYTIPFNISVADTMYYKAIEYSPQTNFYLVMTKTDTVTGEARSEKAEEWAVSRSIRGVFYTSAVTGAGIEQLFNRAVKDCVAIKPEPFRDDSRIKIESTPTTYFRSCC